MYPPPPLHALAKKLTFFPEFISELTQSIHPQNTWPS